MKKIENLFRCHFHIDWLDKLGFTAVLVCNADDDASVQLIKDAAGAISISPVLSEHRGNDVSKYEILKDIGQSTMVKDEYKHVFLIPNANLTNLNDHYPGWQDKPMGWFEMDNRLIHLYPTENEWTNPYEN